MPSWVVPTTAAELWGVSLETLLAKVSAGTLKSQIQHGFVLVEAPPDAFTASDAGADAAHAAKAVSPPRRRRRKARTRTYTPVPSIAPADSPALSTLASRDVAEPTTITTSPATTSTVVCPADRERTDEEELGPSGDPQPGDEARYPDDGAPLHWQEARARVSRTRRPPRAR